MGGVGVGGVMLLAVGLKSSAAAPSSPLLPPEVPASSVTDTSTAFTASERCLRIDVRCFPYLELPNTRLGSAASLFLIRLF